MKKNNKILLILGLLLITVTLFGCQPKSPQKPNMDNQDRLENRLTTERRNQNTNPNVPNKNTVPMNPNKNRVNDTDIGRRDINNDIIDNNDIRDKDNDLINDNNRRNMVTRHERIVSKINDLEGVKNSTVILSGNTALVGVDIDQNLEGKVTDDLKRKIEKIVRNTDKNIENVGITADPDIFERIKNMARDVRNGAPIKGFGKEIEEMFRRIVPGR